MAVLLAFHAPCPQLTTATCFLVDQLGKSLMQRGT